VVLLFSSFHLKEFVMAARKPYVLCSAKWVERVSEDIRYIHATDPCPLGQTAYAEDWSAMLDRLRWLEKVKFEVSDDTIRTTAMALMRLIRQLDGKDFTARDANGLASQERYWRRSRACQFRSLVGKYWVWQAADDRRRAKEIAREKAKERAEMEANGGCPF
jgi:hypothetical protein